MTIWKRYIYKKAIEDGEEMKIYTRWENDYNLLSVDNLDLLDEYLEMVIQYGFVTLFVAAFPLAPLFAFVNNLTEIRVDANKYIFSLRRPLAQRAQDIGAWLNILESITYISVLTNGLVIALTSDFIPRMVYKYAHSDDNSLEGFVEWKLSSKNSIFVYVSQVSCCLPVFTLSFQLLILAFGVSTTVQSTLALNLEKVK